MTTNVDIEKVKPKYDWMMISLFAFVLFVAAGSLANWSTQRDWPLYFTPFTLVTYVWSAIAMRSLANATGGRGPFWGWLAICLPLIGILVGYVFVGRPAKRLINQIRWAARKQIK